MPDPIPRTVVIDVFLLIHFSLILFMCLCESLTPVYRYRQKTAERPRLPRVGVIGSPNLHCMGLGDGTLALSRSSKCP